MKGLKEIISCYVVGLGLFFWHPPTVIGSGVESQLDHDGITLSVQDTALSTVLSSLQTEYGYEIELLDRHRAETHVSGSVIGATVHETIRELLRGKNFFLEHLGGKRYRLGHIDSNGVVSVQPSAVAITDTRPEIAVLPAPAGNEDPVDDEIIWQVVGGNDAEKEYIPVRKSTLNKRSRVRWKMLEGGPGPEGYTEYIPVIQPDY